MSISNAGNKATKLFENWIQSLFPWKYRFVLTYFPLQWSYNDAISLITLNSSQIIFHWFVAFHVFMMILWILSANVYISKENHGQPFLLWDYIFDGVDLLENRTMPRFSEDIFYFRFTYTVWNACAEWVTMPSRKSISVVMLFWFWVEFLESYKDISRGFLFYCDHLSLSAYIKLYIWLFRLCCT